MSSSSGRVRRRERDPHIPPRCPSPHANATSRKNLKGFVWVDHLHACVPLSSPGETDGSLCGEVPRRTPLGDVNYDSGAHSAAAAQRRRQSRLLDRWATRQAREMISTIERQAREAELRALCDSHPVSNKSPSFLQETSPAPSDVSGELPTLRASSMVQMWKELEAEAASPRVNRTNSMNSTSSNITNNVGSDAWSVFGDPSPRSDNFDSTYERFTDWESEPLTPTEPASSSRVSSEIAEGERGRVADMIKKLTSGIQMQSDASSFGDENDIEEQSLWRVPPPISVRDQSLSGRSRISYGFNGNGNLNSRLVRGRQGMRNLLIQIRRERKKELARLEERHAVSKFSHRGRIQSLIRFRFLGREVTIRDHWHTSSTSAELNQLQRGTSIMLIRERLKSRVQQGRRKRHICYTSDGFQEETQANFRDELQVSENAGSPSEITEETSLVQAANTVVPEAGSSTASPNQEMLQENNDSTIPWREEAHGEASLGSDVVWREESASNDNLDWRENTDNLANSQCWEGDIIMGEVEPNLPRVVESTETWQSDQSRGWEFGEQSISYDWLENFSDNMELRELLERRKVSTALGSEFRERMDKLLLSHLERLEQEPVEEDAEQVFQQENHEMDYTNMAPSTSVQLPLPSQYLHRRDDTLQQQSFARQLSATNSLELELISDLRGDMSLLHQEISELKQSVKSCLEMQAELRHSLKQEGSSAVVHSGSVETFHSINRLPRRTGNCCICYEMPVDSLLYRCGHMCTCYKCANELQWSSGRCPICRSPIIDVVLAYSHS